MEINNAKPHTPCYYRVFWFSVIILYGHSHVSLLIHLGYDFLTIAERIGHDDIKYIMETYGHLYPEKHTEVVRRLEQLESEVAIEEPAATAEN